MKHVDSHVILENSRCLCWWKGTCCKRTQSKHVRRCCMQRKPPWSPAAGRCEGRGVHVPDKRMRKSSDAKQSGVTRWILWKLDTTKIETSTVLSNAWSLSWVFLEARSYEKSIFTPSHQPQLQKRLLRKVFEVVPNQHFDVLRMSKIRADQLEFALLVPIREHHNIVDSTSEICVGSKRHTQKSVVQVWKWICRFLFGILSKRLAKDLLKGHLAHRDLNIDVTHPCLSLSVYIYIYRDIYTYIYIYIERYVWMNIAVSPSSPRRSYMGHFIVYGIYVSNIYLYIYIYIL